MRIYLFNTFKWGQMGSFVSSNSLENRVVEQLEMVLAHGLDRLQHYEAIYRDTTLSIAYINDEIKRYAVDLIISTYFEKKYKKVDINAFRIVGFDIKTPIPHLEILVTYNKSDSTDVYLMNFFPCDKCLCISFGLYVDD